MSGEIVEFPGRQLPPYSKAYIDQLHSEAFRDLESSISDFVSMGQIAAQRMSDVDKGDEELAFSVFHLNRMLKAFKEEYYARWHGDRRG